MGDVGLYVLLVGDRKPISQCYVHEIGVYAIPKTVSGSVVVVGRKQEFK